MFAVTLGLLAAFAALTAGMLAGKAAEPAKRRRDFLIGLGITAGTSLLFLGLASGDLDSIREFLAAETNKMIYFPGNFPFPFLFHISPRQIPGSWLWLLATAALILAFLLYLLAFNCRRRAGNRWTAVGGIVLFGAVFCGLAPLAWYGLSAFLLMLRSYSPDYPYVAAGIAFAVLTAALLAGWTFFALRAGKAGWRRLLAHAGILAGTFAACWLLALAFAWLYGTCTLAEARKLGIAPWSIACEWPPELKAETEKIDRFRREHKDFELPIDSVYNWRKRPGMKPNELVPDDKREYTLKLFDTPEYRELLASYEKLVKNRVGRGANLPVLNQIRAYARLRAGNAILYLETGRPEKILPEFEKIAEVDFGQGVPQSQIEGLVHIAVRFIWFSTLMNVGPDGPEYAPFYRKMLEKMKSCQIHIPDDAGCFLPPLEAGLRFRRDPSEPPATLCAVLLTTPVRIAFAARGFRDAVSLRKTFRELERVEVFGADPVQESLVKYARNLALRSRTSFVLGTTGLALKLYRSEKGHYPQKLEELVPEYLEKLPPCPFNGKPLLYESDGKDFELRFPDPERGTIFKLSTRKNY